MGFRVEHPNLRGVTAVVTGAGRGLGKDFAMELARCGASVAVTGRDHVHLRETARTITEAGGTCLAYAADVTDRAAVEVAAAQIASVLGPPSLLVNNAGQLIVSSFLTADPEEWWRVVEVNLRGTFNWAQVLLPGMVAAVGGGRVINVSSIGAKAGPAMTSSYNASKAAVSGLTQTLAAELPPKISVFALAPYGLTDMTRYLLNDSDFDSKPLAALLDGRDEGALPETLAVFRFLVSGEADHLSGRHIDTFEAIDELREDSA